MLWIAIIVGILVEEEGKSVFQMKSLYKNSINSYVLVYYMSTWIGKQ